MFWCISLFLGPTRMWGLVRLLHGRYNNMQSQTAGSAGIYLGIQSVQFIRMKGGVQKNNRIFCLITMTGLYIFVYNTVFGESIKFHLGVVTAEQ